LRTKIADFREINFSLTKLKNFGREKGQKKGSLNKIGFYEPNFFSATILPAEPFRKKSGRIGN